MDHFWKEAVKVTGAVGVVGFLFGLLLTKLFQQQIIDFFGSEKMFYIIIAVVCILGVALLFAIFTGKVRPSDGPTVVYRDKSKHQGDNRF